MNNTVLTTVAATGFSVAFFHAAIPTHWLPFVLVARARGWGNMKTLTVAAAAGLGHVAITTAIGLAIAWFGFQLNYEIGHLFQKVAGGVLLAVAAYYLWRQWQGKGICHHPTPGSKHEASADCGHEGDGHSHWEHELAQSTLVEQRTGDRAAIGGLLVMLTLSPCEAFLPVYVSGLQFGWPGFWLLSGILAVATLLGMWVFTWLTLLGLDRINLRRLERWESGLLGVMFLALGTMLLVVEHDHSGDHPPGTPRTLLHSH